MAREQISIGNGGWVLWLSDTFPHPVWIRFGESAGGRLDVRELYVAADDAIDSRTLHSLPLGRIRTWINGPRTRDNVKARLDLLSPPMRRLATYYGTSFGEAAPDTWIVRAITNPDEAPDAREELRLKPQRDPKDRYPRVPVPGHRPYPDTFYRSLAALQAEGIPAKNIAEASSVPVTTVYRWFKEARRRGFLPPGRAKGARKR